MGVNTIKTVELEKFGINRSIIEKLVELGYEELTEVQRRAIESGLFNGESVLVSAPTNTGKTFIGEIAFLVASTRKVASRTFYLVPLKALAEEKFGEFKTKYENWGLRITISTSDRTEFDDELANYDVVIATYEKLNALLIRRPELLGEIGLVIVDELQNLGDESRGQHLEVFLTRLIILPNRPQIVGLSATIPNASDLAEWLGATLIDTEKRDVELREGILYTGKHSIDFQGHKLENGDFIYREFNSGKICIEKKLRTNPIELTSELGKSEQTLVFVDTQRNAEFTARNIANGLPSTDITVDLIDELDVGVEFTPSTGILKRTLQNGVAFHHAGLLPEERSIIENGFRTGKIRVICSTTTLGAGVNTPAKNVIVLSYKTYGNRNILTRDYKNMVGRAGRLRTRDNFGRSILFAENGKELEMLWKEYVTAKPEPVKSQIPSGAGLESSILGLLASGVCSTVQELESFLQRTLHGHVLAKEGTNGFSKQFETAIRQMTVKLGQNRLVEIEGDRISVTELGRRCAEELLTPDTVLLFYKILSESEIKIKAVKEYDSLAEGLIHLCCSSSDASLLYAPKSRPEIEKLQATWEVRRESFLYEPSEGQFLQILRTTRMLMRWIDGASFKDLSGYAPPGIIKRIAENISWILKGLARVAEKPLFDFDGGFPNFIGMLANRVFYGVPTDSLTIIRLGIPAINRSRATRLAKAGFKNIDDLIAATTRQLMSVNGIGEKLALRIMEHVENFIKDDVNRNRHRQLRLAQQLGRNGMIIEQLYETKGDGFSRVCIEILRMTGLNAIFIGDSEKHEVDGIVTIPEGKIVIEGKRKEKANVLATEAEEVLGKGARHNPISYVTIGFPDFVEEAKRNASNAKVTLIKASVVGDILIAFWERKLSKENIINILRSGKYIASLQSSKG